MPDLLAPPVAPLQVLVDEEDRRFFKQQEITLFRLRPDQLPTSPRGTQLPPRVPLHPVQPLPHDLAESTGPVTVLERDGNGTSSGARMQMEQGQPSGAQDGASSSAPGWPGSAGAGSGAEELGSTTTGSTAASGSGMAVAAPALPLAAAAAQVSDSNVAPQGLSSPPRPAEAPTRAGLGAPAAGQKAAKSGILGHVPAPGMGGLDKDSVGGTGVPGGRVTGFVGAPGGGPT